MLCAVSQVEFIRNQQGGNYNLFVYTYFGTPGMEDLHRMLLSAGQPKVMSIGTETVLRAHQAVATIDGAFRHPGQT